MSCVGCDTQRRVDKKERRAACRVESVERVYGESVCQCSVMAMHSTQCGCRITTSHHPTTACTWGVCGVHVKIVIIMAVVAAFL